MSPIKHIWFDFSYTIAGPDETLHKKLLYETYAAAVGKEVSPELIEEYQTRFAEAKSHSGVFASLGYAADYWSNILTSVDPQEMMRLMDLEIPEILAELREIVPISMWSNVHAPRMFPALGLEEAWFTHILGPSEVQKPKPALDGFLLLIERSALPPEEILFVGDAVEKEMRPAKSVGLQTGLMWDTSSEADYCFKGFREVLNLVK